MDHRKPGTVTIRSVSSNDWEDTSPEWRSRQIDSVTYRMCIGCDIGYTEGAGDMSAIIPVADLGDRFRVHDCITYQRGIVEGRRRLLRAQRAWPGAPMAAYISGPEKGILQLLAHSYMDERGVIHPPVLIAGMRAIGDITLRAQATAEMWNEGKITIHPKAPWAGELVEELTNFTGRDSKKDRLSALISAVDYLLADRSMGAQDMGAYKRTRV